MQLIGAGFGRTGTSSLKVALEMIGFGPCYHMQEVIKHPGHVGPWLRAGRGESVDFAALLAGYQAGVDYPVANFYRELMATFPEAKVLLSVRDPQAWYDSTLETIYQMHFLPRWFRRVNPLFDRFLAMVELIVWDGLFEGRFEEKERALAIFADHVAEVKTTVPPEKLLVFDVREGWEPLCAFLEVPVPDQPFPHVNDRQVLQRLVAIGHTLGWLLPAAATAGGLFWWWRRRRR
ncbi:MAG: hypothetical protein KDE04_22315 [Anaerolineales bacterium]|nr:hypothetical protein [Anaerolineales bacterium]